MSDVDHRSEQALVKSLLGQFAARADPGPFAARYCHHFPGQSDGPHVVLGVITHGNEWGSLPAAVRLQTDLLGGTLRLPFSVTILLGNPEAALVGRRFVEEDFNRVMTFDRPAETLERRRALEVRPLLDSADFFLDIHQTQTPTSQPFWTMPWERDLGEWARALGAAPVGLTRAPGAAFSQGKCCLDEYVRARGKVGITVEIGEKGLCDEQAQRAQRVMARALEIWKRLLSGEQLQRLAEEQPEIAWYETKEVVSAAPDQRLRPGISNFMKVEAGEVVSAPGTPELRASTEGCILFPKYPAPGDPPPPELFLLGVPLADPEEKYGFP